MTRTPKLRISQFQNATQWEEKKLGEVCKEFFEKAGVKKYVLMSVTSGIGLVSQIEKFGREIAGSQYKNYLVIHKYDFAYNKSATKQYPEGFITILKDYDAAALPNSIFTCFRIIDKNTSPFFLNHLFHSNYHGFWLRKFIEVSARAHGSLAVDSDVLFGMPIFLSSLPEQQKYCHTKLEMY